MTGFTETVVPVRALRRRDVFAEPRQPERELVVAAVFPDGPSHVLLCCAAQDTDRVVRVRAHFDQPIYLRGSD